jgi:hypothetical protein
LETKEQTSNQKMPLPTVPSPLTMPFYYSSLNNCIVHYLVDKNIVKSFLEGTGFSPALFGGLASVSFNFQLYVGQFSAGKDVPPEEWNGDQASIGVTQEVELNIVVYPTDQAHRVADVDFQQWVMGDEQSKLMGNHRVWVPCDSKPAIMAGEELFGEPKFFTSFKVNLPSFNPLRAASPTSAPDAPYRPVWENSWGFRVNDPEDKNLPIFTCIADMSGRVSVPGNISSITEYGKHDGRAIGCRWNILQPLQTYFFSPEEPDPVKLTIGPSQHQMAQDMKTLLAGARAQAVQTFVSSPVAIQSRAYFL